jgi:phage-related tail fiber protein
VPRASYPALYTAIGNAYGTADISSFNLPDLRGKFLRGVDAGTGNDPDAASRGAQAAGGNTGNAVGSVQADGTAVNNLGIVDPGHTHNIRYNGGGGSGVVLTGGGSTTSGVVVSTTTGISLSSSDGDTRPINAYVNFIIKT